MSDVEHKAESKQDVNGWSVLERIKNSCSRNGLQTCIGGKTFIDGELKEDAV